MNNIKNSKTILPVKLLVIPSWYPPDGGYFFQEHAEALAERGCHVDLLVNRLTGITQMKSTGLKYLKRFSIINLNGTRVIRSYCIKIPKAEKLNIKLWTHNTLRLYSKYQEKFGKPDLILAHSSIWAGLVAAYIHEKYNIPYIITEHRSRFILNTGDAGELIKDYYLPLLKRTLSGCSGLITVSKRLQDTLRSIEPSVEDKLSHIPNMINTDFFCMPDKPRLTKPFIFFSLGLLEKVKGFDLLIGAFARLAGAREDVILGIGGRGSMKRGLERLVRRYNLEQKVFILGYLSRNRIREEYHQAGAFVLASRFEAFGVVYIEAMATGLPVIGTRSGGPEEIIKPDCGILVNNEDIRALAEGMGKIMDEYSGFDQKSIREHVKKNYGREIIAHKYITLFEKVLHDQA